MHLVQSPNAEKRAGPTKLVEKRTARWRPGVAQIFFSVGVDQLMTPGDWVHEKDPCVHAISLRLQYTRVCYTRSWLEVSNTTQGSRRCPPLRLAAITVGGSSLIPVNLTESKTWCMHCMWWPARPAEAEIGTKCRQNLYYFIQNGDIFMNRRDYTTSEVCCPLVSIGRTN